MKYHTVYRTNRQNQIIILKGIFKENKIEFRILRDSHPADFPPEIKVQVVERDRQKAQTLLRENGFISSTDDGTGSIAMAKFWLWLVIALLALITASFLINYFL